MARVYPLFSSSKGNATFVGSPSSGILIDAGVSCKRLSEGLEICGINVDAVKAIFITHEHSDHVSGLNLFSKKYNIPVFAQEKTLEGLIRNNRISSSVNASVVTQQGIEIDGMFVKCFSTPHDTEQSCGYRITMQDDKVITICTDLGNITSEVESNLVGSDLVLLESNYDEGMLKNGSYPYYLKKRILSDRGHLANNVCAKMVRKLLEKGTTRVILGHLSQENNTPSVAENAVLKELEGFCRNKDYILSVAPVATSGAVCIL
jgi:phosphoribosyl 1,2-cyclic phosphodiesterase